MIIRSSLKSLSIPTRHRRKVRRAPVQSHHLKGRILKAAVQKHEALMNEFRNRIKEVMEGEKHLMGDGYDNHHYTYKTAEVIEANLLNEQLNFASREWEELMRSESHYESSHERVELGSVVITDCGAFFVSAGIEDFDVNGKWYFGLSVYTPLYMAMRGKGMGDFFEHRGKLYRILRVF